MCTVCRTEPNLNDVGLAFNDLGINLEELADFVDHVEAPANPVQVPKFPVPRPNSLQFPAQNSRELKEREEHVHDHLPPMFPQREGGFFIFSPTHRSLKCTLGQFLKKC